MEKHKHPLDEFFREELKDFRAEPSVPGRETFLKSAEEMLRNRRSRQKWFYLPILLVMVAGIATGIYFMGTSENPGTGTSIAPELTNAPAASIPTPAETVQPATLPPSSSEIVPPEQKVAREDVIPDHLTQVDHANSSLPPPSQMRTSSLPEDPLSTFSVVDTTDSPSAAAAMNNYDTTTLMPDTALPEDTDTGMTILPEKKKKDRPSSRKDLSIMIGAQYTSEWMFNTLEGDKYVNNFGLEGTFRFGRYSVKTGLGLSITKGTNELIVDYNEYLGSYNALDSITFQWDDQHYHLLPTYYLTDQNVWDTKVTQEQHKLVKRYTYLQIPLVLGYDFVEKGWFSFGFRAGPVLSLLLKSEPLTAQYDPGQDKIITINQVTPDRIQTNWQVMGGLNFGFAVARRWVLELEPEARYYFNSVYEKSDITKKPWSIGIRAAINFDLKK